MLKKALYINRLLGNFRDQRVSQSLSQDEQFNTDSFCLIRNHQESNFQWEGSINKVISRPRLLRRGHAFSLILPSADWKQRTVRSWGLEEPQCGRSLGPRITMWRKAVHQSGRLLHEQETNFYCVKPLRFWAFFITASTIIFTYFELECVSPIPHKWISLLFFKTKRKGCSSFIWSAVLIRIFQESVSAYKSESVPYSFL